MAKAVRKAKKQSGKAAKNMDRPKLHLIKEALERAGKSQYWLAESTGITDVSINGYFHNRIEPSLTNLKKIVDAFNDNGIKIKGGDLLNF